ncbi:MAG: biotin transporter BioY, partial [Spirochaetales bacterium]
RPLQKTVLTALSTALVAGGAFIAFPIPISPVPIVLQNFFILLMALVLGGRIGAASVALYLLLGAFGLPIFAGGKGGFAHFFGPTGGYLLGFLLAATVTGFLSHALPLRNRLIRDGISAFAGALCIYLLGVPWLAYRLGTPIPKAVLLGVVPFLPGDVLKTIAAVLLAPKVRSLLQKEFFSYGT